MLVVHLLHEILQHLSQNPLIFSESDSVDCSSPDWDFFCFFFFDVHYSLLLFD